MARVSDPMTSPGARVLLVDDDRSFLGIITDTLREGGYAVDGTSDPADALRRAGTRAPHPAPPPLVLPPAAPPGAGGRGKAAGPPTPQLILSRPPAPGSPTPG